MSKNYAKIPPRAEQRYRKNSHSSKSGYFILLLLVIIGITGYYVFSRGIFFSKNPNEINHQTSKTQETPPQPAKPRFEFYTLLSKETVPVSQNKNPDQSVTADATTSTEDLALEAAAKEKAKEAAEENTITAQTEDKVSQPATLDMAPSGVPAIPVQTKHSRTTPSTATPQAEVATQGTEKLSTQPILPAKPAPMPLPTVSSITNTKTNRYLLQVAALQRMSDVDQLKAKLSFLGFDVSVEPFQRSGVVWYRIKVGPYSSPESMQKARQVLSNNGLGSIVITLPPSK